MIAALGVLNTDGKSLIYKFFAGSEAELPLASDYPLMAEGSVCDVLDYTATPATIKHFVYLTGSWVEYTEGSGGDTPTPTPGGDLTSITLQWVKSNSGDSGGIPSDTITVGATPTVIDSTFMTTNNYGIQIKAYEPEGATGIVMTQNGYHNKCTLVKQSEYQQYVDQEDWIADSCPVYIPAEGGDWYEFPGEDSTVTVVAMFGETVLTSTLQIVTP